MATGKKTQDEAASPAVSAVIYADGGCKPTSRGFGGWGIHGYTYIEEPAKQGSGSRIGQPTPQGYDRTLRGNPAITLQQYVDGWGSLPGEATNNIAELMALKKAMEVAAEVGAVHLTVLSDSRYAIDGMSRWLDDWQARGWCKSDGSSIANQDIWQDLLALRNALQAKGMAFEWRWVEGHDGNGGNELAHQAASKGVVVARKRIVDERIVRAEARGYWTRRKTINRMFSHSHWYFNTHVNSATQRAFDGRYIYYLGDHGKDESGPGKPMSDCTFSVLYLKEPEPVLETIRAHQDTLDANKITSLVISRLDRVFQPEVYQMIEEEKDLFLFHDGRRNDLYIAEKTPVTEERQPPHLSHRAVETLSILEGYLHEYLDQSIRSNDLTVTDITGDFYLMGKKPDVVGRLKPEIDSSMRSVQVTANYKLGENAGEVPLILTIGLDTAKRNDLAALAERNPRIYLLTWRESDTAFRYATVIEADGEVGIWAAVYSNLRLI